MGGPKAPPVAVEVMTQMAEFECRSTVRTDREGYEHGTNFVHKEQRPVSVRIIRGEDPVTTEDRFEKAAEIELRGIGVRKEMKECGGRSVYFTKFVSTAPEFLKAKAEWAKAMQELSAKLNKAYLEALDKADRHGGGYGHYR